jgi:4-hydroxy-tetrahydrodipicolinate synthase
MASAAEAKEWARTELRGLVEANYLTYDADGGLDEAELRDLVRYMLVDLDADGLHIDSTVSEFWAVPRGLRMRAREVILDEMNKVRPDALKVVCCYGTSPYDIVELVNNADDLGADLAMIMTPYLEGCGERGVKRLYEYVAANTNLALGVFNSEVSGLVLTPEFIAELGQDIPAVCAVKNAIFRADHSIAITRLSDRSIQCSEYDLLAHLSGIASQGLVAPVQLGNAFYMIQRPGALHWNVFWNALVDGDLETARAMYFDDGLYDLYWLRTHLIMHCLFRPGVWHHHANVMKYWCALIGMPVGANPDQAVAGAPQPDVDAVWKERVLDALRQSSLLSKVETGSVRSA